MTVISKAIAERQAEIDRLKVEIDALSAVESLLSWGVAAPKPALKKKAKARKKRRGMSAAEKKAVSERMRKYWAKKRRGKKKGSKKSAK